MNDYIYIHILLQKTKIYINIIIIYIIYYNYIYKRVGLQSLCHLYTQPNWSLFLLSKLLASTVETEVLPRSPSQKSRLLCLGVPRLEGWRISQHFLQSSQISTRAGFLPIKSTASQIGRQFRSICGKLYRLIFGSKYLSCFDIMTAGWLLTAGFSTPKWS